MASAVVEVPESQAEGKTKSTYDDIRETLRLPRVPYVFRALATHPDYLALAWAALKPNARTMYFERRSDSLRRLAVDLATSLGSAPKADESALSVLRVLHYAAPKVLLATAALRSATNGSQPAMQHISDEEKRQLPAGIPDAATAVPEPQTEGGRPPALQHIEQASPGLAAELADLTSVGGYLEATWTSLEPILSSAGLQQVEREIRRELERSVTALPFRMDLSTHALLQGGLSEADVDAVRDTLRAAYRSGTAAVVVAAFLASGMGRDAAAQSPFPV